MTIIEEDLLSGRVRSFNYRSVLIARLSTTTFTVYSEFKWSNAPILKVPVHQIKRVVLVHSLLMFGFRLHYIEDSGHIRVATIKTPAYPDWANAFSQLGISIVEPRGWFDFDGSDYVLE